MHVVCPIIILTLCRAPEADVPHVRPEEETILRVVGEGYRENRELFNTLTCRFRVRLGIAASLEEALQGTFETNVDAEGLWIVDGRKVRFEIIRLTELTRQETGGREDAPEEKKGGFQMDKVPGGMLSKKILDDGQYQLTYGPDSGIATIRSPKAPPKGLVLTPFDMGVMGRDESLNPPALIDRALRDHGFCRVTEEDGQQAGCYSVTYGDSPGAVGLRFVLDPSKGSLPREIWSVDQRTGKVGSKVFVTDYLQCSNGGWAPKRSVYVRGLDQPPCRVREIELIELDVDRKAGEEDFVLQMDAGTTINDPAVVGSQAKLVAAPEEFALADLPGLPDRIYRSAFHPKSAAPESRSSFYLLWAANSLVLVIVVFLVLRT